MQNNNLTEGLRPLDLKEMIYDVFEVDCYRSKMGEDQDVCVVSFTVKDRYPAKDLMEFVEKGYSFVLDADVSSGENNDGEYSVFIELERSSRLSEQIKDLTYGICKLTGIDDWKFKYHKSDAVHEASAENLKNYIPSSPKMYEDAVTRVRTEGIKKFFSKTLMDDLTLEGDVITIHKPFNQQIKLRMVKEAATDAILEGSEDIITMDQDAMSEIFWLTKVLGDYQINKIGDKYMFDNNGQAMLLQRI
jgi:hypothetical protein